MHNMFCFQCQETCGNTGCTMTGVCGKTSNVANVMDRLIFQLKLLAFARKPSHELAMFVARSLFMTVTNTDFDEKSLTVQLRRAERLTGGTQFDAPCGVQSSDKEDIVSLREFVTYALKGISAYMVHADELQKNDESLEDFLFYALREISSERSVSELFELLNECGSAAVKAMALLDEANTESFGSPEKTVVHTVPGDRSGILVSGHDLLDLYELLLQTAGSNIDVYTHSEMLPAHAYPLFKKFTHFRGHYGTAWYRQNIEFDMFNGPVLLTSNCISPVQEAYKKRIFTTGCCHYPGVVHIPDRENGKMKDFSAIIELAGSCLPPLKLNADELTIGFAHAQLEDYMEAIIENIRSGAIRRFIVMAGCDGRQKAREYYSDVAAMLSNDTVILTAGCAKYRYNRLALGEINGIPRLLDAGQCNDSYSIAVFALKLKEAFQEEDINKLPISFDIAWYEQKAVAVLLALLSLGFKNIRLGPTLPAFVSPHILKLLVRHFKLKNISMPHVDIVDMMRGK